MARRTDKRVNIAVARVIPAIIIGVIIYACYAVTKQLCIDYLIHPSARYHHSPRVGAGVAIIVIFYVLLIPVLTTYLRLLYTVIWHTGFLPRGAQCSQKQEEAENANGHQRSHKRRRGKRRPNPPPEKVDRAPADVERGLDYDAPGKAYPFDASGLEGFYTKDVFVCQEDGKPPYCSTCCQFKTDRAHHCREVDRCVRKMDHFCPWVGGVVSETSFKFFLQFVFYTAIFCTFNIIVISIFTAEVRREAGRVNAYWLVVLGVASLFGLFTIGMTGSSLQLAVRNLTTIENLSHRSKVWTLAVHVPRPEDLGINPQTQWASTFPTVSYPAQPSSPLLRAQGQESKPEDRRVFAILRTQPGENPWDLGSPLKNLQQVMGYTVAEWLLPFKHSPCANHSSLESAFALGPVVQRLKREAGLEPPSEPRNSVAADEQGGQGGKQHKDKRADRLSVSRPSQGEASNGNAEAPSKASHHRHRRHDRGTSDASTGRSHRSNLSGPSRP